MLFDGFAVSRLWKHLFALFLAFWGGSVLVWAEPALPASSSRSLESLVQTFATLAAPQASGLIAEVLMHIQLDYVEPHRLQPLEMFRGSLRELARTLPEIQGTLKTNKESYTVRLKVNTFQKQFTFSSLKTLYDLNLALQSLTRYLNEVVSEPEKRQQIEYALIQGFLTQMDPHSLLLPKEIYNEFQINTSGNFGGIGIMIGFRNGQLSVIAPIDGTPAARAGLKAKDLIVRIDNEETSNMSLSDTVERLRGEKGTSITLYIMRQGFTAPRKFELVRDTIKVTSVESTDLKTGALTVRYLKLKNFQETTYDDLNEHLQNLDQVQGLIFDMRNNPGGLLDQAVRVADRFLPEEQVIVSTVSNQKDPQVYKSRWSLGDNKWLHLPMIVLINGGSASASEIVAAALKNNHRALLIGEQSFGKGSVQSVWELEDEAALKLTIAKYLTPGNKSIQSVGVTPDLLLYPVLIGPERMHLSRLEAGQREKLLSRNFVEWSDQPEVPSAALPYLAPPEATIASEDATSPSEEATLEEEIASDQPLNERLKSDFFVQLAQKIFWFQRDNKHSSLLETALKIYPETLRQQENLIIKELQSYHVDWQIAGTSQPTQLTFEFRTEIKAKDNESWSLAPTIIPANSKIRFWVTVRNLGEFPMYRLLALVKSNNPMFDGWELPFGYIPPGGSQMWAWPVTIPLNKPTSVDSLELEFTDQLAQKTLTKPMLVTFQAAPQPQFHMTLAMADDGKWGSRGNGDGLIQAGEQIALQVQVLNQGKGTAEQAMLLLKKDGGEGEISLTRGRTELGKLGPNQKKTIELLLTFKTPIHPQSPLTLLLEATDETFTENTLRYRWKVQNQLPHQVLLQAPMLESRLLDAQGQVIYYETELARLQLKGHARDDQQLKDVFIFLNEEKIFYQANSSLGVHLNFQTEVNLRPGHNRFTIYARDQNDLITHQDLEIWRQTEP